LSKKHNLFQWKWNPESGEYDIVPLRISPEEFWNRYVNYNDEEEHKFWTEIHTPYDWLMLDAVDEVIDEMDRYPDAERIVNLINRNIGDDREN